VGAAGRRGVERLLPFALVAHLHFLPLWEKMEPAHPSFIVDPSSQMVVQVTTQVMVLFLKACL